MSKKLLIAEARIDPIKAGRFLEQDLAFRGPEGDILLSDENLRTYVMLKDSAFEVCPGDMEIDVWMTTPDDQPFKDFFELVGLPYVQPRWLLGCLYF